VSENIPENDQPVKGKFAFVRLALRASDGLTRNEGRVFFALAIRCNDHGVCWPSQMTIAVDLGFDDPDKMGRKKVQTAIKGLKAKGVLETKKRPGGRSITYHIKSDLPESGGIPENRGIPESGGMTSPETGGSPPRIQGDDLPESGGIEGTRTNKETKEKQKGSEAEKQPDLGLGVPNTTKPDQVQALFQVWQEATGKAKTKLDTERRKWIKRGIKDWGADAAGLALRGMALDPFAMGDNDRHTPYNEPRHCFAKAERAEHFITLAAAPIKSGLNVDQLQSEWMELYMLARDKIWDTKPDDGAIQFKGTVTPWIDENTFLMEHRINHSAAILAGRAMLKKYPEAQFITDREIKDTQRVLNQIEDEEAKRNAKN